MEDEAHHISPTIIEWFKRRGISEKTLKDTGIYSGRQQKTGDNGGYEVIPDVDGNVIVYPYLVGTEEVNAKYRTYPKKFWQKAGGQKTFWNANVLDDPTVKDGTNALVITEGEMDALAVIEAGYPYVVSVPDGAPPPVVGKEINDDIDAEHDIKYGYIYANWDKLKSIRRIIIATDADDPGRRLAEELVRRLGRVRCQFVSYPVECKDLNDVLLKHSPEEINITLRTAKPYPLSGVYLFSELPAEPDLLPLSTGWGRLDQYIKPFFPAFMVVTGTAGSGKSTWVNQLVAQMAILHGTSVAIASFEMRINPFVSEVLLNVYNDLRPSGGRPNQWLEENFVFIAPEPGDGNDEFNIDWLISKAEEAVIRHGIRILVVDPWNEIEHAVRRLENHSDYVGRAIRSLKRFGREFNVLVIVVAHPSKNGAEKARVWRKGGDGEPPICTNEITLYDVADTAHFSNKADFGVVINRRDSSFIVDVLIKKIRYQPMTGSLGSVELIYNETRRTFGEQGLTKRTTGQYYQ